MEFTQACTCVRCQRSWTPDESISRLGKTFWNTEYRRMRRQQLRRTDETLIAETLNEAAYVRDERRLTTQMESLAREIRNGRMDLLPEYRRLRDTLVHATTPRNSSTRTLLKRCAETGCPGFLMSSDSGALVCQTCATHTCAQCGERVTDAPHTCDENIVASRRAILTQCKPCVRCYAPSIRTEGCPTMWCPHCHTFWNWDTERVIETRGSNPHNPDHRAFLVNGGRARREVDDVPCGGLPDGIVVHNAFIRDSLAINHLSVFAPIVIDALECIHLSQRMRHRYPLVWNPHEQFRAVRIAYILGDVTPETYETTLERMERSFEFRREIGTALELMVLAGADTFQRLCTGDDDITSACFALNALRDIVDTRMLHIGTIFQRKPPRLGTDWKWSGLRR